MLSHHVHLRLPDPIFRRLKARADHRHRSMEEELLALAASVAPDDEALSSDQEKRLDAMTVLTDQELWLALQQPLPRAWAKALEQLNQKRAATTLSETETRRHARLVEQCEWNMLVRAQAAKLLTERGHDIAEPSNLE